MRAAGVTVHIGHDAANVPAGADVFYSTAIPPENPERGPAARPRADLLAELSTLRRVIAVAGAHGKTTTTSMAAHALLGCGLDPGYLIGGELTTTGTNAAWGTGEWLVVEADESDRSMLSLHTDIAVLTNVELDHHATYGSLAELEDAFRTFLAGAPVRVVAPGLERLAGEGAVTFAPEDLELDAGGSRFAVDGVAVRLAVPGEHKRRNAAAALVACRLAGADPVRAAAALASFRGAGRRFQTLGVTRTGARVIDDYAHHPTEVAAAIAAARTLGAPRVVAVFQPHLYSRTQHLADDFGAALAAADAVCVLDVYPARERAEDFPGVDGRLVADAAADHNAGIPVLYAPAADDAEAELRERIEEGDVVLVMGAGDVDALARRLVA